MMALMGVTGITLAIAYAFVCSYVYLEPTLPSVSAMKNNELAVPLRVYTRSGDLIAQIGEQRRNPVKYEQIPLIVRQAFIAAEDDRFFEHHGYDWQGILRTLFVNATSGELQGASTITMQAARSAFFTQERTVRRKLQEIFVTNRLEHEFTKGAGGRLRQATNDRGRGDRNVGCRAISADRRCLHRACCHNG